MNEVNETITKLFELMKERGVTAKQLSAETGITQSCFTEWKKGRANPKTDALITLSNYFNVPLDYFTGSSASGSEIDIKIQAEIQQLSDEQKADALKYIKYLRTN